MRSSQLKLLVSSFVLLLVIVGAIAGFFLARQSQELRQQAFEGEDGKRGLSLEGNKFFPDGEPFVMRGLISLALVSPSKDTPGLSPYVYQARTRYGFKQLAAAKEWGANTIRFHVSQPGLDKESDLYSKEYVDEVYEKVRLALAQGFVVIVDMQAESASGAKEWTRMPTAQTKRAWSTLAPLFANYPRVMYEVFNEPGLPESETNWNIWLNGGFVPASGSGGAAAFAGGESAITGSDEVMTAGGSPNFPAVDAIGHQEMVNHIRGLGAKNIIIVDGLFYGRSLNKDKLINDPLNKIVYAAHVLYGFDKVYGPNTEELWDQRFGEMSKTQPVMITAWSAHAFFKSACRENAQDISERFFRYISQKDIGVAAWALDIEGTIVKEITPEGKYVPSDFTNFTCNKLKSGGGGRMLQQHFELVKNKGSK